MADNQGNIAEKISDKAAETADRAAEALREKKRAFDDIITREFDTLAALDKKIDEEGGRCPCWLFSNPVGRCVSMAFLFLSGLLIGRRCGKKCGEKKAYARLDKAASDLKGKFRK